MNIDLVSHANTHKSNLFYTDFFINQNINLILMTHHLEQSAFLDSLNSMIINELIDAKLDEIPVEKVEIKVVDLLKTLNTKLYEKFESNQTKDYGLSLLLCIVLESKAYVVQFGRFVCGMINQEFSAIGNDWKKSTKNSENDLHLLGSKKHLNLVPVQKITFHKNSYFVALPSSLAEDLIAYEHQPKKILSQIQLHSQNEHFPYFILKTKPNLISAKQSVFKNMRIRITAVILFFVIILSTLYVFYGKNWLADQQNLLRIKNQEFMRNELLEKVIAAQEVMNQTLQEVYQLEIFPNQKLEFKEAGVYQYTGKITAQPQFDMHSLYLISENTAFSMRKKIGTMKWEKEFAKRIEDMMLIDANRLLVLTADKMMYCLNRETGYEIWQKECDYDYLSSVSNKKLFQISVNRFKQLDSSLILIPGKRKISLINTMNGEIISSYFFENEVQFISNFDLIERSLFIVQNEQVKQIRLEIKY